MAKQISFADTDVWGLYFDGKKDHTFVIEKNKKTGTLHRRKVFEQHISMVKEMGSEYMCHISPESSDANIITNVLYDKLLEIQAPVDQMHCVGSDIIIRIQVSLKNFKNCI